eukprot:Gregarina_sp_Poly_1__5187@NODE_274_length_10212_cov_70_754460_g239_i0_p6_GENE_NODE_274_length_10212_cov_70_754460_g239_i0NODE_274_length_10212_cov_70_754460_g239_i0_p6_ORF_typecomplete_len241_score27_66Sde2_N_Ubi/PF13019_6/3_7e22_NODE_274_length_10212_cov_70_754460_g239_i086669388
MTNIHVKLPLKLPQSILLEASPNDGLLDGHYLDLDWLECRISAVLSTTHLLCRFSVNHVTVEPQIRIWPLEALDFATIDVLGSLNGGKGGFGTLLRGKGARGARTTNFESSRDLQGRRLRNAKAPERMRNWLQRKAQEKAIIKAVGGQDKFLGKPLSAQDVIKLYNISIPDGVYNPFEDQDTINQMQEALRLSAAEATAVAISQIDDDRGLSLEGSSDSGNAADHKHSHMNSFLDAFDDF